MTPNDKWHPMINDTQWHSQMTDIMTKFALDERLSLKGKLFGQKDMENWKKRKKICAYIVWWVKLGWKYALIFGAAYAVYFEKSIWLIEWYFLCFVILIISFNVR